MGLRQRISRLFSRERKKGPKTVNVFMGFFFMVNFCLGTGFLGVPFSFFYAGYLASIPTLLLIAFVSWNNAEWEVETMARAQAMELWKKWCAKKEGQVQSDSETEKLIAESTEVPEDDSEHSGHPRYEIRLTRKFEPTELCEIFLTNWGKIAYIIVLTIYCFLACWSFTTVAGSAWATNIPFNSSSLQRCDSSEFLHVLIPTREPCRNAYMLSVFFFAVITVSLSLLDLKEQAILQMILGLLRFVAIGGILLYVIVKLGEGNDECAFTFNETNFTSIQNTTEFYLPAGSSNISWWWESTGHGLKDLSRIVFRFDSAGWLVSIPVFTYAFIIHQGIPALTHPIREKHLLREFMVAMFGIAALSYISLGVVVPLWFKADIQETCTLNWVPTAKSGNWAVRAISYYLVLFPSIDVSSAYPLVVHTVANNIYTVLLCRDTSKKSKTPKRDFLLQIVIKFIFSILPIAAALLISNLVYVLKYAGLMGFFISFFFPTALQLSSTWKCSKEFGTLEPQSGNGRTENGTSSPTLKGKEGSYHLQDGSEMSEGKCPTSTSTKLSKLFASYQTPYSNRFLSHPIVVSVLGVVGVVLFLLAIASLAVHPEQIHCYDRL